MGFPLVFLCLVQPQTYGNPILPECHESSLSLSLRLSVLVWEMGSGVDKKESKVGALQGLVQ